MSDTLAKDYAAGICDDMAALEWLENNWEDIEDWSHLEELMAEEGEELDTIKAARLMVDDSADSWDNYGGPVSSFFSNDVLDIETKLKGSAHLNGLALESVQALITFGGPNAWIISNEGGDWLDILVNWGGDRCDMSQHAPAVASYLYQLGEMMTESAAG